MKFKIILSIFILLFIVANNNAESQNVYYSEMRIKPSVSIKDDLIFVYTSNSMVNSSLLIYRVFIAVDAGTKSIYLSGNQLANRPYQNRFLIDLKRFGIKDPKAYKYYWLDPDRKKNEIPIISENDAEKYSN